MHSPADLGLFAQLACIWEASARKAGNVHRYANFSDTNYLDFIVSAAAIAPIIAAANELSVGSAILDAIRQTRRVTPRNTNLGIVLLVVPLAKAIVHSPDLVVSRDRLERLLEATDLDDAKKVYEAIRLCHPGGLGAAHSQDVLTEPTLQLRDVMALAQSRDLIARQYVNGFFEIFSVACPAIVTGVERTGSLEDGIILGHLHLMSKFPDTLIARKRGWEEARASAERARIVLESGWPETKQSRSHFNEFDVWLRAVGNQRNPGTTADLIAAGLFVMLCSGELQPGLPFDSMSFMEDA